MRRRSGCGRAILRATRGCAPLRPRIREPRLRSPDQPVSKALIACALRTLETEAGGLAALGTAIGNGLGAAFTAAVTMVSAAQGRVIVSGMGKSGHIGRKIAAT